jgi:hypothetical protein
MSVKKLVNRNVAIALGIVCIILVAGLGAVLFMGYSPTSGSLQTTFNDYKRTHSHSDSDYNSLSTNNTNLQAWLEGNATQYNDYVSTHRHSDSDFNALNSYKNQLETWLSGNETLLMQAQQQIVLLQNQNSGLQSQIANLEAPNLIKVNLKSDDNHPFLQQEYLHVYGEICNVGMNTAYNCKLHVVGYQSGGVVAFDTYILQGVISGYSWTSVDGTIPYNGGALVSWSITQQWTSS